MSNQNQEYFSLEEVAEKIKGLINKSALTKIQISKLNKSKPQILQT